MCTKYSYPSRQDALRNSDRLKQITPLKPRAYHCGQCGSWHITTQSSKQRRAMRKRIRRYAEMTQENRVIARRLAEHLKQSGVMK